MIESLNDFKYKSIITFEGEDWKRYRLDPIYYFLNYIFSTNRFTIEEGILNERTIGDPFHNFELKINDKCDIIKDKYRFNIFDYNKGFFNLIENNKINDEDIWFKIYEIRIIDRNPDRTKPALLLSLKKDNVELYYNAEDLKMEENTNLPSYNEMIYNNLVLMIKSEISTLFSLMPSSPFDMFDKEDDKFRERNKNILKEIRTKGGIYLEKSAWTGKTQFHIDEEITQQSDIDIIISSLKKLKIVLIDLTQMNIKKESLSDKQLYD